MILKSECKQIVSKPLHLTNLLAHVCINIIFAFSFLKIFFAIISKENHIDWINKY